MRLSFALIVAFLALAAPLQADRITSYAPTGYALETSLALASIDVASDESFIESVPFAECEPISILTPDYLYRLICADDVAIRNPLVSLGSQGASDDTVLTIYQGKLPYHYLQLAGR